MPKTEADKIKQLQKFFTDLHFRWARDQGYRYVNDGKIAKELLDVKPVSYSRWINGVSLPEERNAYGMMLSLTEKGYFDEGQQLLEILEYPPFVAVTDPDLLTLHKLWPLVPGIVKEEIRKIIRDYEEANKDGSKSSGDKPGTGDRSTGEG